MGKINYQTAIKESESVLASRLKTLSSPSLRDRCEVLLWLKSGRLSSMLACMRLKDYNKSTGVDWWRIYGDEGLDGLLSNRCQDRGRRSPLDTCEGFWTRLEDEGFSTIKEARDWLAEHHNLFYTEDGLGGYFRRHKIKSKTGRPYHPQRSESDREAYKKNMQVS